MAKEMGFGVVGLGMGMSHCRAVTAAKGARLVAVCDHDAARTNAAVKQYGCKGYTSWKEMLADPEIEAVNICTESGTHSDFGIAAAKAGKHIVCEKPVDVTPARIRKFQDVVERTGVKCGCIFQYRQDPCHIRIKKAIDSGKMGKLIGAHAALPWFREDSYYKGAHGSWKGTWKLDGGGSLTNQGIHTVDLIQWLAGPVESVCGYFGVFNHKIEAEDHTVAILKFANGAIGTLYTTTCHIPGRDQRINMYGTKGSFSKLGAELEYYDIGSERDRKQMMAWYGSRKSSENTSNDPMAVSADGHTQTVEDLVKAVISNRDPYTTIESAKHSVEIATAIFKSARTGREVRVKSVAR